MIFGKKKQHGAAEMGSPEGEGLQQRDAEAYALADPELFSEEEMLDLMARDPEAFLGLNHLKSTIFSSVALSALLMLL